MRVVVRVLRKGQAVESKEFDDVREGWRWATDKRRALDTDVVMVPIAEEGPCASS